MDCVKAASVGGAAGALVMALAFLTLGDGRWSSWSAAPAEAAAPSGSGGSTHEDMHRTMDALHGEGASQSMHEAMGPDTEMMGRCAAMMAMTNEMQDMMLGAGDGMMDGRNGEPTAGMVRHMMAW